MAFLPITVEEVEELYLYAWEKGLLGLYERIPLCAS